jgi:hypothetical protein
MLGTLPGQSGWYRMNGGDVIEFEVTEEGGEAVYKQVGEAITLAAWQALKISPRANASKVRLQRCISLLLGLTVYLLTENTP